MAHAAEIDATTGAVLRVIVVHNSIEPNVEQWCVNMYGGVWRQTSYNANFRKNYAGVGYTYDASLDAFIPPKPYPSWSLDANSAQWKPPTQMPADGKSYTWDEPTKSWVQAPHSP